MKKVGTESKTGDEDQRFEREIRLEHDQGNEPGEKGDDAESKHIAVPRKDPQLDGHHVNGEDDRIAHDQEHVGVLRQDPFPEGPLENEEEKIEPDQPLEVGGQAQISRGVHGVFFRRKPARLAQQLSRARPRPWRVIGRDSRVTIGAFRQERRARRRGQGTRFFLR